MRAVVQRVRRASVAVDGSPVATVGAGAVILLGVASGDGTHEAERLAGKIARLRIFENEEGRLDGSLLDVGGEALVVSQFTLLADSKRQRGTRPDFSKAARTEVAKPLYEHFCEELRRLGVPVQTGVFGAQMAVKLVNDGPVTIVLETQPRIDRRRWCLAVATSTSSTLSGKRQDAATPIRPGRAAALTRARTSKQARRRHAVCAGRDPGGTDTGTAAPRSVTSRRRSPGSRRPEPVV